MKILVTAAGGSGGRFLTEALQAAGHYIIGTDCDPTQLPLAWSDEKHLVPRCSEQGYLAALSSLCENLRPDLLMPQSDPEVAVLCKQDPCITDYTRLFLPEPEMVRCAQDKWHSHMSWIRYPSNAMRPDSEPTVPTPETFRIGEGLQAESSQPWPFLLKSRHGAGGQYMLRPQSVGQANAWISLHPSIEFLGQAWMEGTNCVCDLVFREGKLAFAAGRKVLSWQMAHASPTGITGASKVTHVLSGSAGIQLEEVAEAAVRALPGIPHGIFGVDTIQKNDGSYWVTEVNAGRFNAPGPALYMRAGCNMASLAAGLACASSFRGVPPVEGPYEYPIYAMLRGQDTKPVYLTKAEWEELCA